MLPERFFEAGPMDNTVMWKSVAGRAVAVLKRACASPGRLLRAAHGAMIAASLVGTAINIAAPAVSYGGVLGESDMRRVETVKPLFQNLMADLVQTSKRTDISASDAECVTSTMRELLQISEELSSYEYLITIEKEITDA